MVNSLFAGRLAEAGLTPLEIAGDIRRIALMVAPASVLRVVPADPDDDHVLACALAGEAGLIVSGDKDLHAPGGAYRGIRIVTPAEAARELSLQ